MYYEPYFGPTPRSQQAGYLGLLPGGRLCDHWHAEQCGWDFTIAGKTVCVFVPGPSPSDFSAEALAGAHYVLAYPPASAIIP